MNITTNKQFYLSICCLALTTCLVSLSQSGHAQSNANGRHSVPELQAFQPDDFHSDMSSTQGESQLRETALANFRTTLAQLTPANVNEQTVGVFNSAVMFNLDKKLVQKKLRMVLRKLKHYDPQVQREILSAVYTRYAKEMAPIVWHELASVKTEREFAIAGYVLLQTHMKKSSRNKIFAVMKTNFPDWTNEPRLLELDHALHTDLKEELHMRPPLVDLLAAPIQAGYPVVFSFQRKNRDFIGLAMVRGADGRFVRNPDGSYFNIPQLARASNNLPSTIANGNTPQGIYTVKGTDTSTEVIWIGPTPFLNSLLPVEGTVADFKHHDDPNKWTEEIYTDLLPASWKNYFPIKEAWRAGLAGRNEILAHGTTVNREYYHNESYYPGTPSAGCLVAMEYWSPVDGKLMHSDQLSLVKAFVSGGSDLGYMVVVNLDNLKRPVVLSDVIDAVILAEAAKK